MPHNHEIIDTDIHYKIDGVSRIVSNINETKRMLVQNDHNSERFTFEIPRYVDGHDFSECNLVQVHYVNSDLSKQNKNVGIYEVDDLHVSTESEDAVVLTWLISSNATKFVGTLSFSIRFACVDENGKFEYVWNTTTFEQISIQPGIFNSNVIVEEYPDVLNQWKQELINETSENAVVAKYYSFDIQAFKDYGIMYTSTSIISNNGNRLTVAIVFAPVIFENLVEHKFTDAPFKFIYANAPVWSNQHQFTNVGIKSPVISQHLGYDEIVWLDTFYGIMGNFPNVQKKNCSFGDASKNDTGAIGIELQVEGYVDVLQQLKELWGLILATPGSKLIFEFEEQSNVETIEAKCLFEPAPIDVGGTNNAD